MRVTFLGTGTSQGVPVITCRCEVCTSADPRDNRLRSSVLIETQDEVLCIDSGTDFRQQMLRAEVGTLDGILYTHEHKDHIAGLDDIRPFNYMQGKVITLYASEGVQNALRREFSYIFGEHKYHGLPQVKVQTITPAKSFNTKTLTVMPVHAMHASLPIQGFRIESFAYLTDVKTMPETSRKLLRGVKVLVVNALQRSEHVSHFNLSQALEFARDIGAPTTYLTHISHHLGTYSEVRKELPAGVHLAYDGLVVEL